MKIKKYWIAFGIVLILLLPFCMIHVEKVEVEGNIEEWCTTQNVYDTLFPYAWSKSSLLVFLTDILGERRELPFVESYEIEWESPRHIRVQIYNKKVVAYVEYMSSNMYLDKDGNVIESSRYTIDNLPKILGLEYGSVILNQKLDVNDSLTFQKNLEIIDDLVTYNVDVDAFHYRILSRKEIDTTESSKANKENSAESVEAQEELLGEEEEIVQESIEKDKDGKEKRVIIIKDDLVLYINDVEVKIGTTQYLDGKLQELRGMMSEISQLHGILHLEEYDHTGNNQFYTFDKR